MQLKNSWKPRFFPLSLAQGHRFPAIDKIVQYRRRKVLFVLLWLKDPLETRERECESCLNRRYSAYVLLYWESLWIAYVLNQNENWYHNLVFVVLWPSQSSCDQGYTCPTFPLRWEHLIVVKLRPFLLLMFWNWSRSLAPTGMLGVIYCRCPVLPVHQGVTKP